MSDEFCCATMSTTNGKDGVSDSSQGTGSVSFSIEEIKHYLEGLCLVRKHKENTMLNCAISSLDDCEDGIEAVIERRKQNATDEARSKTKELHYLGQMLTATTGADTKRIAAIAARLQELQ